MLRGMGMRTGLTVALALCLLLRVCRAQVNGVSFRRVYANYPKRVFEAQGTVLDGHLTVMGGFDKFPHVTRGVWRRRLTAHWARWEKRAAMPVALTHMAQAAAGAMFCGAGGFRGRHPGASARAAYCYFARWDRWVRLPDLPADRAGGGLALDRAGGRNQLIFAGGVDRVHNSLAKHVDYGSTWTLNLDRRWQGWRDTGAQMPNPRNHMAAVATCGRLFFVGGQHKENERTGNQATVSEYLPLRKRWRNVAPLPKPLGHISASVMAYKCGILVVGGTTQGLKLSDDVYWYNARRNVWKRIGRYPVAAATPVCGVQGSKVLCATGGRVHERDRVYVGTLR